MLRKTKFGGTYVPILAVLLLLPLAGSRRIRRSAKKLGRGMQIVLLALVSLGAIAGIAGCGGGSHPYNSESNNSVTVTATAGNATHTAVVTLQVVTAQQ